MPTTTDWEYTISGGTATLTRYRKTGSYHVNIPSSIGGYTVTNISGTASKPVFVRGNMPIYFTVTLPNTLTAIGNYVFYDVYNLNKLSGTVTIPESVRTIGNYAFYQCAYVSITGLPSSLTSIGDYAFCACRNWSGSWSLPDTLTHIGRHAFIGCYSLTGTLRIPESVTYIGEGAFKSCYGTTRVEFESETAPSIGSGAFGVGESGHSVTLTLAGERWVKNATANAGNEYTTFAYDIPPLPPVGLKLGADTTVYGTLTVADDGNVIFDTSAEITQDGGTPVKYIKLGDTNTYNPIVIESRAGFFVTDEDLQTIWTEGMEIAKEDPVAGEAYLYAHLPLIVAPTGSLFPKSITLFDDLIQGDISDMSPLFSRPSAELCDTSVDTLTIEDTNLAGKILSADNVGRVVPASASQVFGDAGFGEMTPAGTIIESDTPMQLSVETSQDEQEEAMEG